MTPSTVLMLSGAARLDNLGDVAMLQAGVRRARELWPQARLAVVTEEPEKLSRLCPGAQAVPASGMDLWRDDALLLGGLRRLAGRRLSDSVGRAHRWAWRRAPAAAEGAARLRLAVAGSGHRAAQLSAFREALERAQLVLVAGQGGLTDHCRDFAIGMLEILEEAAGRGAAIALVGQGLGPMRDPELRRRAAGILPRAGLLALREGLYGPALARELGVAADRLLVTGDETVEMAHEARGEMPGDALGVCVRVMPSAGATMAMLAPLTAALREHASRSGAPLSPLPIAQDHDQTDARHLRALLPEISAALPGVEEAPEAVIRAAGRCRVVVTGAYHAAVFALAQGVPVVGIAKSDYFREKFEGLAHEFGPGCIVLDPSAESFPEAVAAALREAWEGAERMRPALLASARRQIASTRDAWRRLAEQTAAVAPPGHRARA